MFFLFFFLECRGDNPGYIKVYDSTKEQEKQTMKIKRTVGKLLAALSLQAAGCRLQAAPVRLRLTGHIRLASHVRE